jgi:cellulose synthase/poly-beta-1,6-N-acetylglucosamine synthase-like glycosyltransferase
VTIGIPAYNEEQNIGMLLENVRSKVVGLDYEIVLVSDGSTDRTGEIVRRLVGDDNSLRPIVHPTRLGKAEAINSILREARGDIIVLLSADTHITLGTINTLVEVLMKDPSVGLVWAKPVPADLGVVTNIGRLCFDLQSQFMIRLEQLDELKHSTGELLAFRRGIIDRLPSDCINDDDYLALLTVSKGLKVKFSSEVNVGFVPPKTIPEYLRQRRRWVYGHFQMKRMVGEFPTVLEFSVVRSPRLVTKVVVKQLLNKPRTIFYLAVALLLELIVFGYMLWDGLETRTHLLWNPIESTKKMPIQSDLRLNPNRSDQTD